MLGSSETLRLHHRKLRAFPGAEASVCICWHNSSLRCDLFTKLCVDHEGGRCCSVSKSQPEISQLWVSHMQIVLFGPRFCETLCWHYKMTRHFVFSVKSSGESESGLRLALSHQLSEIQRLKWLRRLTVGSRKSMRLLLSPKTFSDLDLSPKPGCSNNMLSPE